MGTLRFTHDTLPQRVVFSTGQAVNAVVDEVTRLGAGKPMIISAEGTHHVAEKLAAVLPPVQHWRDTIQHVPRSVADAATAAARADEADVLISIGGGSATGLAKAVALDTSLPIIAVPTTYAASEATPVW
ncbi:iron-containing alcohol dehydrogenase, partial [Corynebacterium hylobatis]